MAAVPGMAQGASMKVLSDELMYEAGAGMRGYGQSK